MAELPNKIPDTAPSAMAIANSAVIIELLDALMRTGALSRDDVDSLLGAARSEVARHTTQGLHGQARAYLSGLRDLLLK